MLVFCAAHCLVIAERIHKLVFLYNIFLSSCRVTVVYSLCHVYDMLTVSLINIHISY